MKLQFFPYDLFRNITLKCLTEIANIDAEQYEEVYFSMFQLFMDELNKVSCRKRFFLIIKFCYYSDTTKSRKFKGII